jgi:hypothetical protein
MSLRTGAQQRVVSDEGEERKGNDKKRGSVNQLFFAYAQQPPAAFFFPSIALLPEQKSSLI